GGEAQIEATTGRGTGANALRSGVGESQGRRHRSVCSAHQDAAGTLAKAEGRNGEEDAVEPAGAERTDARHAAVIRTGAASRTEGVRLLQVDGRWLFRLATGDRRAL